MQSGTPSACPSFPRKKSLDYWPLPGQTRPELDTVFVKTRNEMETLLAAGALCRQDAHSDNYFDLGENSLRLAEINQKMCELLRKEFALIGMFGHPTITAWA
jgi:hypothetical protein